MEIENHKEEVPFEHYLEKYRFLDPEEAAERLNILYDAETQKFRFRFMGHSYEAGYPVFDVRLLDAEDDGKDLLIHHLPARTFLLRYLLEGQYANYHFSEHIKEEDITFDYQLKKGRADSRNAIRLLAMVGFERELVEQSMKRVEAFLSEGVWQ